MFKDLHDVIMAHVLDTHPEAACGGMFGDGPDYHPLAEVADRSRGNFRIDPDMLRRMEAAHGTLNGIIHTHPVVVSEEPEPVDPLLATPSAAEMRMQVALAVPFGILICDGKRAYPPFWFGDQCPMPRLLGRPFRHGVTDCYSLIRDWYRRERQIVLPEFPRDWDWWAQGLDLYSEGFGKAGFRPIDEADAREGDVVLFRMRSKVPNHAAILLDGGQMVHHPASVVPFDLMRLSGQQAFERWKRHATHWLRHESVT